MTHDLRELYTSILEVAAPWRITDVRFEKALGEVHIEVSYPEEAAHSCPVCGRVCRRRDSRRRSWRHLDTCQFKTVVSSFIPRVECPTDGVKQIQVPWAEPGSRFTMPFES